MSKRVVVHHAHHPGEGLYRLIHAQQDEVVTHVEVPNPNYDSKMARLQLPPSNGNGPTRAEIPDMPDPPDPSSNGHGHLNLAAELPFFAAPDEPPGKFDPELHLPTRWEERTEYVYSDHQDIVWADDDEQWHGLSDDEIATKQRQQVKEALDAQEQEALKAQQAAQDFRHIGQTEVEL